MSTGNQIFSKRADENVKISVVISDLRTGITNPDDTSNRLLTSNIESLSMVSDIVDPVFKATLIYTDDISAKLVDCQGNINLYATINIEISANEDDQDVIKFEHYFYVDRVNITGKTKQTVTYELSLVSVQSWFFNSNFHVSTFSTTDGSESPIELITKLLSNNEYTKIVKTDIDVGIKIKYLSPVENSVRDTLMDIFLMTTESPTSDVLLLPYDHMENEYHFWCKRIWNAELTKPKEEDYLTKYRPAFKLPLEKISDVDESSNEIAGLTSTDHLSNTHMVETLRKTVVHSFNYDTNKFNDIEFDAEVVSTSFGIETNNLQFEDRLKISTHPLQELDTSVMEYSPWDSTTRGFYRRVTDGMLNNGTVVIDVSGWLYRRPGIDCIIIVEKGVESSSSLISLDGRWLMTKVRHTFTPDGYRNTIVINRMEIPEAGMLRKESI